MVDERVKLYLFVGDTLILMALKCVFHFTDKFIVLTCQYLKSLESIDNPNKEINKRKPLPAAPYSTLNRS